MLYAKRTAMQSDCCEQECSINVPKTKKPQLTKNLEVPAFCKTQRFNYKRVIL